MERRYAIYDVFTDSKLAGNPLAVVFDGDGLSDAAMQAITREFNLSETVFVSPPENPAHAARLRIFTPGRELPFAGHPTVGTAVALAESNGSDNGDIDLMHVLEENVGPVRCAVRRRQGKATFAEFDLPRQSVRYRTVFDKQVIADALSLKSTQIGFENHVASLWSAGVSFVMIPVHDLKAMEEIDFDPALWEHLAPMADGSLASAYVYCRSGVRHDVQFHTRMFSADMGIIEDPATGSAVAAMSGAIHHFDGLVDGHYPIIIEQGVEMGRPSYIHLHMDIAGGEISRTRIGGHAVKIATGLLDL